ncbi:unnamed protein product [Caenorhabditis sp. 36 PRJEB53466]|nr:unnamed protein product [Caenorhabditis sp. 36 PRJEB53466]
MSAPHYFDSPHFLSTALHVMTFLEIPVHIFGTYCILLTTPRSMRSIKWSMLNLHVWSAFLDLGISLLTTPFVLFPAIAGYPLGCLREVGVPTAAQIYLIVMLFATVGVAIVTIFENRFFLLFAEQSSWKSVRIPFLTVNYTLAFLFFIPPYLHIPDQTTALEHTFKV